MPEVELWIAWLVIASAGISLLTLAIGLFRTMWADTKRDESKYKIERDRLLEAIKQHKWASGRSQMPATAADIALWENTFGAGYESYGL